MEELKFSCEQKLLRWDFFSIKPIPLANGCFYFCMQNCYQTHLENDKQKKSGFLRIIQCMKRRVKGKVKRRAKYKTQKNIFSVPRIYDSTLFLQMCGLYFSRFANESKNIINSEVYNMYISTY